MNRSFIEGQTQTIDLDDEDPSIFRTYVAWLYQGRLKSRDIEEELDDAQDFGLHIAEVIVFADKRGICELKNDAISMFLNFLYETCHPSSLDVINCIYNIPKSREIKLLRWVLAQEEVWVDERLNETDHWHPEFMAEIIKVYNTDSARGRLLADYSGNPEYCCESLHKHTVKTSTCSSLVENMYVPAPPPSLLAQQPPSKKRRIEPSTQTVEILDD